MRQWFRKEAIFVYSKEGIKPTTESYCHRQIYSATRYEKFLQAVHGYWIHVHRPSFPLRSKDLLPLGCPPSGEFTQPITWSSTSTHSYGFSSFRQAVPSRVGLDSENMCRTRSCGGGKARVGNSLWRRRRILENRWCGGVSQSCSSWGIPFPPLSLPLATISFLPLYAIWLSMLDRSSFASSHNLIMLLSFPPNASTCTFPWIFVSEHQEVNRCLPTDAKLTICWKMKLTLIKSIKGANGSEHS